MISYILLMFTIVSADQYDVITRYHQNIYAEPPAKFQALDVGITSPRKWACPIPYVIANNITYPESISEALQYIMDNTAWSFVERTDEKDYLHFKNLDGCWSYIGKIGGEQEISIAGGCDFGAIVHEIAHAIGLTHEQSRLDRNSYVNIEYDNVEDDKKNNFRLSSYINYGDYDFESLMHYDQWAFSSNGEKTIELIVEPAKNISIGQRYMLSDADVFHLNKLIDGPGCTTTVRKTDCQNDNLVLTGGRNINTFGLIYNVYTPNGDNKYRSLRKFQGDFFYIQKKNKLLTFGKDVWQIKHDGKVYAEKDGSLCEGHWSVYNLRTKRMSEDESSYMVQQECGETVITVCSRGGVLIPSLIILAIMTIIL